MRIKNTYKNFAQKAAAFCLVYTLLLLCIPNLRAQNPADLWKMRSDEIPTVSAGTAADAKVSASVVQTANALFNNAENAGNSAVSQPQAGGNKYVFVNVEFATTKAREAVFTSTKKSRIAGATVLTVIDRFADVFLNDEKAFDALVENPGVVWIDGFEQVIAPPPPEPVAPDQPSKAVPEQIVRGGFENLKGKNVIIAVVDTGVDFRHPDFLTYDADGKPTSRLLYLWDTGLNFQAGRGNEAPFKYPNNAPVGTVFTREQLTAELRSTTVNIPPNDLDGHGTACASIAAGNGNADFRSDSGLKRPGVMGVAPEADIIAVSLDSRKRGKLHGAYLINAISEWLDRVAGAKPLVVSNSWGGNYGGRDGQLVSERQLNVRYPLNKKGRAILFAAGNEGELDFHSTVSFSGEANAVLVPWSSVSRRLDIYFDTADIEDVEIALAGPTEIQNVQKGVNALTKQGYMTLTITPGMGGIYLFTKSGKTVKADLYLPAMEGSMFHPDVLNDRGLVGTPGTMTNAITVGSYDWNDNFHRGGGVMNLFGFCSGTDTPLKIGNISCYSSPGPTRDGRMKPEISAPGQWFTSSHAKINGKVVKPKFSDTTENYMNMNGTSAATPYTAGIVALMFEKKPALTLGEIKRLLETNATRDPFTGVKPDTVWGAGKLDFTAVSKIMAAIK